MILRDLQSAQKRKRSAFTLMEILVVVAIIVAVAGMGIPYVIGYLNEAKKNTAQVQCQQFDNAIDAFYVSHKRYPISLDELFVDVDGPDTKKMKDPRAKTDPWNNQYQWIGPGSMVTSNGPPNGSPINAYGPLNKQ